MTPMLACYFCPWFSEDGQRCILDGYDPALVYPPDCPRWDSLGNPRGDE